MTCRRGCCDTQAQHYRSVFVIAKGQAKANGRERRWARDLDAYRNLRRDGLQPPRIDGARNLEQRADCAEQVESGMLHVKPESFDRFADVFGHKATEVAP